MRILCNILVVLFVTTTAVGQQINPVPDYIFRNSMSVGRNAPTDTSAYFSIGPRFGATRGFMPPMVVDTAAVTGTKRNGLLIYSIQRNSFLYWDSTGMRWSRIAANLDTLLLSTRAWRQKGIDSVASVRVGGSGTTNYVPKFTAASTLGNSQIFDNGTNIGIGTITPGQKLDIVGNTITRGYADVNNGTHFVRFQMPMASGTTGLNTFISNASGTSLTGSGNDASYNVIIGHSAGTSLTTGGFNTAVGTPALQATTTGIGNTGIGSFAAYSVTTGIHNTGVGFAAIGSVSTASNNTAVGRDALGTLTTGANNVGIGWRAGHFRSTSQSNSKTNNSIFIGYDTRSSADSVNNVIAIGTSVIDNGSNTTTIGNSSTVGTYIPAGESYFGTTTDAGDYRVQVAGRIYSTTGAALAASSGEVYIGTDQDAGSFLLQVNGAARIAGDLTTIGAIQTGSLRLLNTGLDNISGASQMYLNSVTTIFRNSPANSYTPQYGQINQTGLSIGTSVSNHAITIDKGNATASYIQLTAGTKTGNGANDGFHLGIDTSGNAEIRQRENLDMLFYTNNTDRGRLSAAGELWLGYTADQGSYILQANGSGYFSGSLTTGAPTGGTAQPWKLGTVATVSPTSPNRTIEVEINGTTYYLHAKTTND
jgi:hypothetical protein